MLYQFENIKRKLDEWGFPKVKAKTGYIAITTDFNRAYQEGKIMFRDNGIYLTHEGNEYKGYMYMPTYQVSKYGSYSRMHLTQCSVIQDFLSRGMFNTFYKWSNNPSNDITDRNTREVHKDISLKLCSRCRNDILEDIEDSEDFFIQLDISNIEDSSVEVDINGYVKDKEKISKAYRDKVDYTCENCGVKPKQRFHNHWWHTDHVDGDKTNNKESNLNCLCIICHAFKDSRHQTNFSKRKMKLEISSFYNEYEENLKETKNPHLSKISNFLNG